MSSIQAVYSVNQEVLLDPLLWQSSISVNNVIEYINGNFMNIINISNNGSYLDNVISWDNLENIEQNLTFEFTGYNEINRVYRAFNGKAIQPILLMPIDINTLDVTPIQPVTFNGNAQVPVPLIHDETRAHELVLGTDFTVSYTNNLNAGKASVTITGIGIYTGTTELEFTINKAMPVVYQKPTASNLTIGDTLSSSQLNNGVINDLERNKIEGIFSWSNPSSTMLFDSDQIVNFTHGNPNYESLAFTVHVVVNKIDINTIDIPSISAKQFNGLAHEPDVEIKVNLGGAEVTLVKGEAYTLTYENNVNAGTATVHIIATADSFIKGERSITFEIRPALPNFTTLPTASDVIKGSQLSASQISGGVVKNIANEDLAGTYTWKTPTTIVNEAGSFDILFTPTDTNYSSVTLTLSVALRSNNIADFEIAPVEDVTFTGAAHEPIPSVHNGDYELVLGTDFTVSFANNINAGTATITFTGINDYIGTDTVTFIIKPKVPSVGTLPTASDVVKGSQLSVSLISGGVVKGVNEQVLAGTYVWVNPGTVVNNAGHFNVIFIPTDRNYSSVTLSLAVGVTSNDIADFEISEIDDVIYNGEAHELIPKVHNGDNELVLGQDFTIEYENNINAGTATITIKGIGIYTGTEKITFEINPVEPVIDTLPTASEVVIGSKLSTSLISGGVIKGINNQTITGTYSWKNGDANVISNQSFEVTFTPDSSNYKVKVFTLPVVVQLLELSDYEIKPILDLTYNGNEQKPDIILVGKDQSEINLKDTFFAGWFDIKFENNFNPGTANVEVKATATNPFFTGTVTQVFTINKALPIVVELPTTSRILENTKLSNSRLTGGIMHDINDAALSGTFTWNSPDTLVLNNNNFVAIFTPDNVNYQSIEVLLPVQLFIESLDNYSIKAIEDVTFDNQQHNPSITLVDPLGAEINLDDYFYQQMFDITYSNNINAGQALVVVTPSATNDAVHGEVRQYFTIKQALPTISQHPVADSLAHGDRLENAQISGGVIHGLQSSSKSFIELEGTFSWNNQDTIVTTSKEHKAIFTPNDLNYAPIELMIHVVVNTPIVEPDGPSLTQTANTPIDMIALLTLAMSGTLILVIRKLKTKKVQY